MPLIWEYYHGAFSPDRRLTSPVKLGLRSCTIRVSDRVRFGYETARDGDVPRLGVPIRPVSYHPDTQIVSDTDHACPATPVYVGLIHLKNKRYGEKYPGMKNEKTLTIMLPLELK